MLSDVAQRYVLAFVVDTRTWLDEAVIYPTILHQTTSSSGHYHRQCTADRHSSLQTIIAASDILPGIRPVAALICAQALSPTT